MKTPYWIILLLACSGLTSRLSYRWGQRTERLDLAYQETVQQALLERQLADRDPQQWHRLQKQIRDWTPICAASSLSEIQRAAGCFLKETAQQQQAELVKRIFEDQPARPSALPREAPSGDRTR